MGEGGSVDGSLPVAQVCAVVGVGHTPAAAVGLDQLGEHPPDAGHEQGEGSHVGEALGLDQDLRMGLGQSVAAGATLA